MLLSTFLCGYSFFLLCATLVAGQSQCSTYKCLSVVISTSRGGSTAACSLFFRKTVIPSTRKDTVTSTRITSISKTTTTEFQTSYTSTTTLATSSVTTITTTFVTTTVTATDSLTTTSTSTPTGGPSRRHEKRQSDTRRTTSQTEVPAYASSACPGTFAYSSACSCIGVSHTTITASTETVTSTVIMNGVASQTITKTITQTPTTTSTQVTTEAIATSVATSTFTASRCPQPQPTFYIRMTAPNLGSDYTHLGVVGVGGSAFAYPALDMYKKLFTRDVNCTLQVASGQNQAGKLANFDYTSNKFYVYFDSPEDVQAYNYATVSCGLGPPMSCSAPSDLQQPVHPQGVPMNMFMVNNPNFGFRYVLALEDGFYHSGYQAVLVPEMQ